MTSRIRFFDSAEFNAMEFRPQTEAGRQFAAAILNEPTTDPDEDPSECTPEDLNTPTGTSGRFLTSKRIRDGRRRLRFGPVYCSFGSWAVTRYGVENIEGPYLYSIPFDRVNEPDWVYHMSGKNWVVVPDFAAALRRARDLVDGKVRWPGYRRAKA